MNMHSKFKNETDTNLSKQVLINKLPKIYLTYKKIYIHLLLLLYKVVVLSISRNIWLIIGYLFTEYYVTRKVQNKGS